MLAADGAIADDTACDCLAQTESPANTSGARAGRGSSARSSARARPSPHQRLGERAPNRSQDLGRTEVVIATVRGTLKALAFLKREVRLRILRSLTTLHQALEVVIATIERATGPKAEERKRIEHGITAAFHDAKIGGLTRQAVEAIVRRQIEHLWKTT